MRALRGNPGNSGAVSSPFRIVTGHRRGNRIRVLSDTPSGRGRPAAGGTTSDVRVPLHNTRARIQRSRLRNTTGKCHIITRRHHTAVAIIIITIITVIIVVVVNTRRLSCCSRGKRGDRKL